MLTFLNYIYTFILYRHKHKESLENHGLLAETMQINIVNSPFRLRASHIAIQKLKTFST